MRAGSAKNGKSAAGWGGAQNESRSVFRGGVERCPSVKNNNARAWWQSFPTSFAVALRFFIAPLEEAFQPGGILFGPDAVFAPRHAEELVERER